MVVPNKELTPAEQEVKRRVMNLDEFARMAGISVKTAKGRVYKKEIPATRRGNNWFFRTEDVIAYLGGKKSSTDYEEIDESEENEEQVYVVDNEFAREYGYKNVASLRKAIEDSDLDLDLKEDEDGDLVVSEAAVAAAFEDSELIVNDEYAQERGYEDVDELLQAVDDGELPLDVQEDDDGDLVVSEAEDSEVFEDDDEEDEEPILDRIVFDDDIAEMLGYSAKASALQAIEDGDLDLQVKEDEDGTIYVSEAAIDELLEDEDED